MDRIYPWPSAEPVHHDKATMDRWFDRQRRLGIDRTYSWSVSYGGQGLDETLDRCAAEKATLGLVWGPNEKIGKDKADPTWDANDQDLRANHIQFSSVHAEKVKASGVPISAAVIDIECYVYAEYLKKNTGNLATLLTDQEYSYARRRRIEALARVLTDSFGLRNGDVSVYQANRLVPQVRWPSGLTHLQPSSTVGPMPSWLDNSTAENVWPHVPAIAHATLAANLTIKQSAGIVYQWAGVRRDGVTMSDVVVKPGQECVAEQRATGCFLRALMRYTREVWLYSSSGADMLAAAGITREQAIQTMEAEREAFMTGYAKGLA